MHPSRRVTGRERVGRRMMDILMDCRSAPVRIGQNNYVVDVAAAAVAVVVVVAAVVAVVAAAVVGGVVAAAAEIVYHCCSNKYPTVPGMAIRWHRND